jgi:RNA polymerase sigma factor (sigma-70 family)
MDADTAIGGQDGRFPETARTRLREIRDGDTYVRRLAHDAVVAAYWKPVYKYIRFKWHETNENAKDLTQGFFTKALASRTFADYDPRLSPFRSFLRLCADRYVSNERASARRQKRGGAGAAEPLDENAPDTSISPDEYFHREWVRQLFALATADLEQSCRQRGRHDVYRAFEMYDLAGDDRASYADVAAALGVPVTQVTNYLAAARRDLRRLVLSRLRQLTATEQEYRAEARAVLGIDV